MHVWIEKNSDIIRNKYHIDLNDVVREMSIQKLVKYSKFFTKIDIDILSDQLRIKRNLLEDIILEHKKELEKFGLKLRLKGELIVKE